ncbi:MAG TPA: PilZ domain-containing protein [Novosphingobium sp.]|nr:PilZ domain-containing protein [Novosphingobium sp.]
MESDPRSLRRSDRLGVVLPARCRTRSGFVDRVVITDLSEGGCRVESRALTLREGDLVVVSPGVIEGICGQVRWVKGHKAGIAFLSPLYGPVVEHIHRQHAQFLPAERPADGRRLRLAA